MTTIAHDGQGLVENEGGGGGGGDQPGMEIAAGCRISPAAYIGIAGRILGFLYKNLRQRNAKN